MLQQLFITPTSASTMSWCCVTGIKHTICLSEDGKLYSFGSNVYGRLGLDSSVTNVSGNNRVMGSPQQIQNLPKITMVSCGFSFTVCIDEEGFAWSFGLNEYGQSGLGNNKKLVSKPLKIENIPPANSISCGGYHTLILTTDLNLWACGLNESGQLFLECQEEQTIPKQTSFSEISKICAGAHFSFIQNMNGKIYGRGDNLYGQLGLGHNNSPQIIASLVNDHSSNIVQFCCGLHHALFLDDIGNVYSVGKNESDLTSSGQLGLGNFINQNTLQQIVNIPPIQTISCSGSSSYLLDFEGNVWSFGLNTRGQLGQGNTGDYNVPTKIKSIKDIQQLSYVLVVIIFLSNVLQIKFMGRVTIVLDKLQQKSLL